MSDPNSHAQTVNVEQIMAQIRARIRDRRGDASTEPQIRELAAARLAGLIGSHEKQAELIEALRRGASSPAEVEPIGSPVLGLFLRPGAVVRALRSHAEIARRHEQFDAALFALIENLVIETTRLEVEVKKLEMRLESQAVRFDFAERRARSLEGMIRHRSEPASEPERSQARVARDQGAPAQPAPGGQQPTGRDTESAGSEARRKRRRRRGRRGGANRMPGENAAAGTEQAAAGDAQPERQDVEPVTGGGESPAPESPGQEPPVRADHDDQ